MDSMIIDNQTHTALESLEKMQQEIQRLREFIAIHSEKLSGTQWSTWAYTEIRFACGGSVCGDYHEKDARAIARRFPGVVWTKKKNIYTCGSVDFCGELDGVAMRIEHAETITFKDGGLVTV